jgi:hypothetical protein
VEHPAILTNLSRKHRSSIYTGLQGIGFWRRFFKVVNILSLSPKSGH